MAAAPGVTRRGRHLRTIAADRRRASEHLASLLPPGNITGLRGDEAVAATGGTDKESFGYALGYVIGALEAKAMDAYESVFGNVPGW